MEEEDWNTKDKIRVPHSETKKPDFYGIFRNQKNRIFLQSMLQNSSIIHYAVTHIAYGLLPYEIFA